MAADDIKIDSIANPYKITSAQTAADQNTSGKNRKNKKTARTAEDKPAEQETDNIDDDADFKGPDFHVIDYRA